MVYNTNTQAQAMTAMKQELQRDVFAASGERLVAACEVHKPYKKKKTSFLCLVRGPVTGTELVQVARGDRGAWRRKRAWPLAEVQSVDAGPDPYNSTLEVVADKLYSWMCCSESERREWVRALASAAAARPQPQLRRFPSAWLHAHRPPSTNDDVEGEGAAQAGGEDEQGGKASHASQEELRALAHLEEGELGALLEAPGAAASHAPHDAELWVRRLAERLGALDQLNVQGMLSAEAGSTRLLQRLERGADLGEALAARRGRYEQALRCAGEPIEVCGGQATGDAAARLLRAELADVLGWLDSPDLPDAHDAEMSLATAEGRARLLRSAEALRTTLEAQRPAYQLRLGAVRERLRRLGKCREQMAASVARHLNNLLIHLGNEAWQEGGAGPRRHHAELVPYAPFMRWLRAMDERAYHGLTKVYVGAWARVYERELRALCEEARAQLQPAEAAAAPAAPSRVLSGSDVDALLDKVAAQLEASCNAEQDFCAEFFCLDADKAGAGGGLMGELFAALEGELLALLGHVERHETYGAMRALACLGRRVLGAGGEGGEAQWARSALAAAAVAAKRQADRQVAERLAALGDASRQVARRTKCGLLPALDHFEELTGACESIFSRGGRRADVERWYVSLATGLLRAIAAAEHPRTPRAVIQLENYHRLHALLSSLRLPALDAQRREAKQRYGDALRAYVTQYFGRPLDKLNQFFEGVAEAVAAGVREEEVCYRAAFSKHELRRVLALYPREDVRRALHRLYRTVEKHLSEAQGLLQVVWRAMQEEFIAQHKALEARLHACYPGAGLALPLSTHDILDAFSDIARSH